MIIAGVGNIVVNGIQGTVMIEVGGRRGREEDWMIDQVHPSVKDIFRCKGMPEYVLVLPYNE